MKQILSKILREYEQRRMDAIARMESKKAEVYKLVPRLLEIDNELSEIGLSLVKLALSGDETKAGELRIIAKELQAERDELMQLHGNYIIPSFLCSSCNDTGFLANSRCSCLRQRLIEEYYDMSNLRSILEVENFDTFDERIFNSAKAQGAPRSQKGMMRDIRNIAVDFVDTFSSEFNNLLFYGDAGLGKTFLCHCIAKALLDKGHSVLYLTAPRFCRFAEDYRFNRDILDAPEEMMQLIDDVDLLIIDDLGTEFPTVITVAAIFDVINNRILTKKSTIVSTNLNLKERVEIYSERVESRFIGFYEVLTFCGDDLRKRKREQKGKLGK